MVSQTSPNVPPNPNWKIIKYQKENTDKSTRLENIISKLTLEIQHAHNLKQIKENIQNATINLSSIRKNSTQSTCGIEQMQPKLKERLPNAKR